MNEFLSFRTDRQSVYFISTRLFKDKIDGVRVKKFQLAYVCNRNHPSHKNVVIFCREVHYMWWGNQEWELQHYWD